MPTPRRAPSAFESRVYEATRLIPRGKVTTYGLLAAHLGCASPRAVGQALKRNPFAPKVPCHRVVSADFSIGGFTGSRSGPAIVRKLKLLRQEGVVPDPRTKRIGADRIFRFKK